MGRPSTPASVSRRPGALAAIFCGLGIACGSLTARRGEPPPLPPAGSERDDGSGLLFRISTGRIGAGKKADRARQSESARHGGQRYGGQQYGGGHDDPGYGAAHERRYGGTRYAGYRFEPIYHPPTSPPQPYAPDYLAVDVKDGGQIAGTAVWPRPPSALPTPLVAESDACGEAAPNNTLLLGERGRVKGAVVFLDDIRRGRRYPPETHHLVRRLQTGGVLLREGCRLSPHVQVMSPIGAILTASNLDEGDQTLGATRISAEAMAAWAGKQEAPSGEPADPADSLDLRLDGPGAYGELALERAGFYRVRPLRDRVPAQAWVVVAPHPYYVLTDERGDFRLDDVPPGRYTLVVWHPPVATGREPNGALRFSPPVMERRTVWVRAHRTSRVTVELRR